MAMRGLSHGCCAVHCNTTFITARALHRVVARQPLVHDGADVGDLEVPISTAVEGIYGHTMVALTAHERIRRVYVPK